MRESTADDCSNDNQVGPTHASPHLVIPTPSLDRVNCFVGSWCMYFIISASNATHTGHTRSRMAHTRETHLRDSMVSGDMLPPTGLNALSSRGDTDADIQPSSRDSQVEEAHPLLRESLAHEIRVTQNFFTQRPVLFWPLDERLRRAMRETNTAGCRDSSQGSKNRVILSTLWGPQRCFTIVAHEPDFKRQRLYEAPPHQELVPRDMIWSPSTSFIPVEHELDEMPSWDTPAPSVQVDIPDHVSEVPQVPLNVALKVCRDVGPPTQSHRCCEAQLPDSEDGMPDALPTFISGDVDEPWPSVPPLPLPNS